MNKIIVILDKLSTEERKTFWNTIIDKYSTDFLINSVTSDQSIRSYVDSIPTIESAFIIFAHNSDIHEIEKRTVLMSNCVQKKIPLVLYSGGSTGEAKFNNLLLDNLHSDVLEENIGKFLMDIKDQAAIEEGKLELLVAIDPKLEERLLPFESTSPYATEYAAKDKSKKLLKDAKAELQTYVEEYIKKQSK